VIQIYNSGLANMGALLASPKISAPKT